MFDPYYQWLGIPPQERPINFYRLLGLVLYEANPDVIEGAADRQMKHVQDFKTGKYSSVSQQLLNELSQAKLCLLNPAKKAAYDRKLQQQVEAPAPAIAPVEAREDQASPSEAAIDPQPAADDALAGLFRRAGESPAFSLADSGSTREGVVRPRPGVPVWAWIAVPAVVLLAVGLWFSMSSSESPPPEAVLSFDWNEQDRKEIKLTIDGKQRPIPPSGAIEFRLSAGARKIFASRSGYRPLDRTIVVKPNERISIPGIWTARSAIVIQWPTGGRQDAGLHVNGLAHDFARSSPTLGGTTLALEPGPNSLRFSRPGYEPLSADYQLTDGQTVKYPVIWTQPGADLPEQNAVETTTAVPVAALNPLTPASSGSPESPLDLLPLFDPVKHRVRGEWQREGTNLLSTNRGPRDHRPAMHSAGRVRPPVATDAAHWKSRLFRDASHEW